MDHGISSSGASLGGGSRDGVMTGCVGWVLVVLSTIFPMNLRTWIRKNLQGTSSLKGKLEIASFPNLVVPITGKPFSIGGKKNEGDQEEEKSAWVFYILSGFGGSTIHPELTFFQFSKAD